MDSCPWAKTVNSARWNNNTIFSNVSYLVEDMKPYYKKVFNLTKEQTQNMKYTEAYDYADAIFSMIFEGIPQEIKWTDEQIGMINTTQMYGVLDPVTNELRKLWMSRLMEFPMTKLLEV